MSRKITQKLNNSSIKQSQQRLMEKSMVVIMYPKKIKILIITLWPHPMLWWTLRLTHPQLWQPQFWTRHWVTFWNRVVPATQIRVIVGLRASRIYITCWMLISPRTGSSCVHRLIWKIITTYHQIRVRRITTWLTWQKKSISIGMLWGTETSGNSSKALAALDAKV